MSDGISLQSALTLAVGLLVVLGTLGKYLWGLQSKLADIKKEAEDRAQAMERRIQVLELTSLQGPAFSAAMESMRNWMSGKLDAFQRDLHELTLTVAQLVDREGGVSYRPPKSIGDTRKDRAG